MESESPPEYTPPGVTLFFPCDRNRLRGKQRGRQTEGSGWQAGRRNTEMTNGDDIVKTGTGSVKWVSFL